MTRLSIIIATAGLLATAAPLSAQGAAKKRNEIPKAQRPPAGMCRIWLDGVPAGQQPAPTDCATAIRHRPPKGRVVFGEPVDGFNFDRKALQRDRDSQPSRSRETRPRVDRQPPVADRHPRMDSIGQPDRVERRGMPRPKPHPVTRPRPVRRDTSSAARSRTDRF